MLNLNIVVILCIVLMISLINSYAHPLLLESTPKNLERLSFPPDKVIITYSEPVVEKFSYIRVTDSNGNRVDNEDTKYYESENKLIVTLKSSLPDDIYTVTTRVLSKVDGHIVDYTFSFIVGEKTFPVPEENKISKVIYIPESLSKFVGIVGQYMIIGSIFGPLYIWRTSKSVLNNEFRKIEGVLNVLTSRLYILGVVLIFISNFAIISFYASSLGVSIDQAINTGFGNTWLARLVISIIVASLYPIIKYERYKIIALITGFALLSTFSLIGHAAVSWLSLSMDMIHNALASIWIGTIFYLTFAAMPALKQLEPVIRNGMITLIIPRFSKVVLVILPILAITGTIILIFIETDLNLLLSSTYGMLLISKLSLLALMLGIGAFNNIIHRKALTILTTKTYEISASIHQRFTHSLRIETVIGMIVLLSIAFLTSTGVPRAEFPYYSSPLEKLSSHAIDNTLSRLFNSTLITDDIKINLSFTPARVGINEFILKITDKNGNVIPDLADATLKLRQIGKDVSPLIITLEKIDQSTYKANGTITANGKWVIEANIVRTEALSISTSFNALIKPDLDEMRFELVEYDMPFNTLNPVHAIASNGYVWISDGIKPRLWQFDVKSKEFKYYTFNGTSSIKLAEDSKGRIWFTDPLSRQFGYFDVANKQFKLYNAYQGGLPTDIHVDINDDVWLALIDIDTIAKFDTKNEEFKAYKMPVNGSLPAAIVTDEHGNVWIAEAIGRLARLDKNDIKEFWINDTNGMLKEPFALLASNNAIWISEHLGGRITRFDPLLHTFHSFKVKDPNSLPYGMIEDSFGNIWFAQHVLDKIGVLDPLTGKVREVQISSPAWVQFLDIDDNNNIWFAEPRQAKIATISITTIPVIEPEKEMKENNLINIRYMDIATPIISGFIVVSALLFVNAVHALRKSIKYVNNL